MRRPTLGSIFLPVFLLGGLVPGISGCATLPFGTEEPQPSDRQLLQRLSAPPQEDTSPAADLPERDSLLSRAVLARLERVVPRTTGRVVLEVRDREPEPLATSDEKGLITVSKGAVELCLQDRVRGPHLLAFVLAHELAHIENHDFLHLQFLNYLVRPMADSTRAEILDISRPTQRDLKDRELRADQRALVLLTLAGYDPRIVLEDAFDFLQAWSRRILGEIAYGSYPTPEARTRILQAQFATLLEKLDYFYAGNKLFQAGFFQEAASVYEIFLKEIRDPAALNNAGLAYLQAAAKQLSQCDGRAAMRLELPTLLDSRTLAERTILRGPATDCYDQPEFRRLRIASEELFEELTGKYHDYVPGYLNWASLNALSELPEGVLLRVREMPEPGNPNEAFKRALLEEIGLYLWERRVGRTQDRDPLEGLRTLVENHPERSEGFYNLGSLLWETGRIDEAVAQWKRFLQLEPHGVHAEYVRSQLGLVSPGELEPEFALALPRSVQLGPITPEILEWLLNLSRPKRLETPELSFELYRDSVYWALVMNSRLIILEKKLSDEASGILLEDLPRGPRLETTSGVTFTFDRIAVEQSGDQASVLYFQR